MATEQELRILGRVLQMLGSGQALSQDLEDYVVGFHILGGLVADAQAEAETAEMQVKMAWAEAFTKAKDGDAKVSDAVAKAQADLATVDRRRTEIKARERLLKLRGTRDSVQEAINAIKFLGRNGG